MTHPLTSQSVEIWIRSRSAQASTPVFLYSRVPPRRWCTAGSAGTGSSRAQFQLVFLTSSLPESRGETRGETECCGAGAGINLKLRTFLSAGRERKPFTSGHFYSFLKYICSERNAVYSELFKGECELGGCEGLLLLVMTVWVVFASS